MLLKESCQVKTKKYNTKLSRIQQGLNIHQLIFSLSVQRKLIKEEIGQEKLSFIAK
jgi:hypothetical protein